MQRNIVIEWMLGIELIIKPLTYLELDVFLEPLQVLQ
jgi:hypothetical protein